MDPQLHLLHLSSPALPIGAYAYSQGLEYAIEAGWLEGDELAKWFEDGLNLGVAQLDLPVLLRVLAALDVDDGAALDHWNDRLLASRETAELLLEDQQIGAALWRLLGTLNTGELPQLQQRPAYAVAFAVACVHWKIDTGSALQGFAYSWLENQVTAATKLVPLGQSAAQQLLLGLLAKIPDACAKAMTVEDDDIGLSLPGLAMASCHHERQHTRLFRS
ncbi:urease accessory protein UreF [Congregibacter litoralis]|uniref:Urease accessory protein UreF n=1 Tax=Congregibacter litoralis KT71 TaxID=314285 RepID=A4A373_9GAMM|nr:Urease accessory protein UreF [Congregibacter litoralis KT71]